MGLLLERKCNEKEADEVFLLLLLLTVPLWLNSDVNITLHNLNYTTNIKRRLS